MKLYCLIGPLLREKRVNPGKHFRRGQEKIHVINRRGAYKWNDLQAVRV